MDFDFDPTLPNVPCLPDQLKQVILNLIINATYAIAEVQKAKPEKRGMIT